MLDNLNICQPKWCVLNSIQDAIEFGNNVGFPVLVRPSFVLSGAAMRVCNTKEDLIRFLTLSSIVTSSFGSQDSNTDDVDDMLCKVYNDVDVDTTTTTTTTTVNTTTLNTTTSIVVTKYIINACEIEFDGVASQGVILNYGIGEHVENAGVHSGDATVVLPAQKLEVNTIRHVKRYASLIAKGLNITGPFNIQFMSTTGSSGSGSQNNKTNNQLMVIECNLRASRTFPFVSKTLNKNFIHLATKVMIANANLGNRFGNNGGAMTAPAAVVKPYTISLLDIDYVCVKAPMFSFTRLRGADPMLGVEMASTGEVACFGENAHDAFLKALKASDTKFNSTAPKKRLLESSSGLKTKAATILLSIANEDFCTEFLNAARILITLGYELAATPGTAKFYREKGLIQVWELRKPEFEEDDVLGGALKEIKEGRIEMVINIAAEEGANRREDITAGYILRRAAVDFGASLITNVKCAVMMAEAMEMEDEQATGGGEGVKHIGEYHERPMMGWSKFN